MKLFAALTVMIVGLGATHELPQAKRLDRACTATMTAIQKILGDAATAQATAVTSHLEALRPGKLTGKVAFNPSGKSISLGRDASTRASTTFGCGEAAGTVHGLGAGRSRIVSTLHARFTAPGHYTLTFELNAAGRGILARLGAAERAYRKHHRRGATVPAIAYGVALTYMASG